MLSYLSLYLFEMPLWDSAWDVGWILFSINICALCVSIFADQKILEYIIWLSIIIQAALLNVSGVHNDVYRYLWDGWISLQGISPFLYTPDQITLLYPELTNVWYWDLLDFKHLHTIYPGTLQIFFWLGEILKEHSILALRCILMVASFVSMYGLKYLTRENVLAQKFLPFIFLSSFWIFDGVIAVHSEMIIVLFLIVSLLCYSKKFYWLLGIALAALVSTKLYPLILLPFFLRHKYWWKVLVTFVVATVAMNYFFLGDSILIENFLSSLKRFTSLWEASPGMYILFEKITESISQANLLGLCVLGVSFIYAWWKKLSIYEAIALILFVYIVISRTVFSWYWLPFMAVMPWVSQKYMPVVFAPILVFALQYSLIDATNDINTTFIYTENAAVTWFIVSAWLPVYILFIYKYFRHRNVQ